MPVRLEGLSDVLAARCKEAALNLRLEEAAAGLAAGRCYAAAGLSLEHDGSGSWRRLAREVASFGRSSAVRDLDRWSIKVGVWVRPVRLLSCG